MTSFLLVHSPLLGPSVWTPLGTALRERGHDVAVPDFRDAVATAQGWAQRFAAASARHRPVDIVVAHSAAGVAVPLIADSTGATAAIFLDARLPVSDGSTIPSGRSRDFARSLARNGQLPQWTDWWPEQEVRALLPEEATRQKVVDEQPTLPAAFYDQPVPVPKDWQQRLSCRYLRFSAAYDGVAAEARNRGWPVTEIDGTHLEMLSDPDRVADVLTDV